jgi:hypothetical protein
MKDPTISSDDEAVTPHEALVGLDAISGAFDDLDPKRLPGFRPLGPSVALCALADAPEDEVPNSARLAVLHALARADDPDAASRDDRVRLAESVRDGKHVDPKELLKDLEDSFVMFRDSPSAEAMLPEEVAFIGESGCTRQKVGVGSLTGTWIYSGFETDAPFDAVSKWVDPTIGRIWSGDVQQALPVACHGSMRL